MDRVDARMSVQSPCVTQVRPDNYRDLPGLKKSCGGSATHTD